jgi:hypothetical protein
VTVLQSGEELMKDLVSAAIQDSLNFIDELCKQKIIAYPPIDYEICHPSDEELAETLGCWFGSDKWSKNGDSFVQFGQDGTGSLFLLWFYPALTTEPPVVFLGSEGDSCLVAANINDFIRQLASGKLFFNGKWFDPEVDGTSKYDWQRFRLAVEAKLGKSEMSLLELSNNATRLHPAFTTWVQTQIDY